MEGHVFRIRIDLAALQAHLSAEDKCEHTAQDVRQLLLDSGFVPTAAGWWIVHEAKLGVVEPSEVLEAEVLSPPGAAALPTLGELREYEDELDWRENRRRRRRQRLSLLAPLAAAAASFAATVWLAPVNRRQTRR